MTPRLTEFTVNVSDHLYDRILTGNKREYMKQKKMKAQNKTNATLIGILDKIILLIVNNYTQREQCMAFLLCLKER